MRLLSVNPYVRFARIQKKPVLREEVVGCDHRIFFCVCGEGEITVNDKPFHICPDTFLFVRAGIPYKNTSETDEMVLLAFNFDLICKEENMGAPIPYVKANSFQIADLVEPENLVELPPILYLTNFYKKEIFQEIINEYNGKRTYYNERCGALLKDAFICAVRSMSEKGQKGKGEEILAYVREHFNEPLTNAVIAQKFSYHENYLNQLLREQMGQTLHQYLLNYRIKTAISLLQSGEYTVTEVGKLVGFHDIFHFSKSFKTVTGKSPSFICHNKGVSMVRGIGRKPYIR